MELVLKSGLMPGDSDPSLTLLELESRRSCRICVGMDDVRDKEVNCGGEEVAPGELELLLMMRVPEAVRNMLPVVQVRPRSCGEAWGERTAVPEPMLPPRRLCCGGIRRSDSSQSPGIFFVFDVGAVAFMLLL